MAEPAPRALRVTVTWSPAAREVTEKTVLLASGATVMDALRESGWLAANAGFDLSKAGVGVWGRAALPDQLLEDLDRVEIYRALTVDPKVARRERFGRQGARATGLFARKRPGAKSGY